MKLQNVQGCTYDAFVEQGVYCNAHRSQDGCWVDSSQVERTVEGRLKIYVARHGHGTYPKVNC